MFCLCQLVFIGCCIFVAQRVVLHDAFDVCQSVQSLMKVSVRYANDLLLVISQNVFFTSVLSHRLQLSRLTIIYCVHILSVMVR